MNNLTISIIGNKILSEIISELKLFSNSRIIFLDNINLLLNMKISEESVVLFFINEDNKDDYIKINEKNFPLILIKSKNLSNIKLTSNYNEEMIAPFTMYQLKTKINSILAKYKYKFSSIIKLKDYTIDKYERKIKKK